VVQVTYSPQRNRATELAFVTPSFTGSLTTASAISLSLTEGSLSSASFNGTSITLGAGHYLVSCSLGIEKNTTSVSATLDWRLFVDSVGVGSFGGLDNSNALVMGIDISCTAFTVDQGSTSDLEVKVSNINTAGQELLSDYSYMIIWRVDL
jgi:hypothetical protein